VAGTAVIDATALVVAAHQEHTYAHVTATAQASHDTAEDKAWAAGHMCVCIYVYIYTCMYAFMSMFLYYLCEFNCTFIHASQQKTRLGLLVKCVCYCIYVYVCIYLMKGFVSNFVCVCVYLFI